MANRNYWRRRKTELSEYDKGGERELNQQQLLNGMNESEHFMEYERYAEERENKQSSEVRILC